MEYFGNFLAYCAGTGGSVLIIGSAAGVAVMGILKIDFIWYMKNISLLALMGYISRSCYIYILCNKILIYRLIKTIIMMGITLYYKYKRS